MVWGSVLRQPAQHGDVFLLLVAPQELAAKRQGALLIVREQIGVHGQPVEDDAQRFGVLRVVEQAVVLAEVVADGRVANRDRRHAEGQILEQLQGQRIVGDRGDLQRHQAQVAVRQQRGNLGPVDTCGCRTGRWRSSLRDAISSLSCSLKSPSPMIFTDTRSRWRIPANASIALRSPYRSRMVPWNTSRSLPSACGGFLSANSSSSGKFAMTSIESAGKPVLLRPGRTP